MPVTRLSTPVRASRQSGEKDRGSIAFFQVESFASADSRGFWGLQSMPSLSKGLMQDSQREVDNQVP